MVINQICKNLCREERVLCFVKVLMGGSMWKMELGRVYKICFEDVMQNYGWNYMFLICVCYYYFYFWIIKFLIECLKEYLMEYMMICWVCLFLYLFEMLVVRI